MHHYVWERSIICLTDTWSIVFVGISSEKQLNIGAKRCQGETGSRGIV